MSDLLASPDGLSGDLLTVGELLAVPGLDLVLVAGAGGLGRPVRWTHATELVAPREYLRGRELVLTVGSGLRDDASCEAFVAALLARDAAGIAFGTEDVLPEAPAALRRACDRAALPLLEVAPSVPFLRITELLAERLVATRTQALTSALAREQDVRVVGSVLDLVARGLAGPEAARDALSTAGLHGQALVVVARPPDAAADAAHPALVGRCAQALWVVVPADADPVAVGDGPAGVSRPFPASGLREALRESVAALELGRRRGHPVRADRLSTFAGLLDRLPADLTAPFAADLAAPLAEHDARHDGHLLDTLRAFLEHDGSVTATARVLFLHVNSLRHRLARVEELTGRNPLAFPDRVALAVAVAAWDAEPR
jgi:hypothetical protein